MLNMEAKSNEKTLKIFIADDSQIVRDRLSSMLMDMENVEVIGQAKDVINAILGIKKLNPDVVILDIRMGWGSGIEVLQHIKEESPSPLVIIFTNYPYPQYKKKCIELGADYFFDKSTEFEKVPELLRQLQSRLSSAKTKRSSPKNSL